jgi:histidyl-tRNA synthetase
LPQEASKRQWFKNRLSQIFEKWGYEPLETPTLEPLEIFENQIGEGESMFFKFEDNGGRKVALRYDQSVPTARVVARFANELTFPFKRYQIQSAFRTEKPQKGRYREFIQCDADIFGIADINADAEVIALAISIYKELGFPKAKILISDRDLLKNLPYQAIIAIDKLEKIGKDLVIEEMVKNGIGKDQAVKYLNQATNLRPNKNIEYILKYLKDSDIDESWFSFEPTLARSFSYSNGPIWEVKIPDFVGGSVLGGERFDSVIKKISGLDIAATGFGLGFDRTIEAMEQFNLLPSSKTNTQLLVTIFSPDTQTDSIKLANQLRQANINTLLYPTPEKLSKQFKYASEKSILYVAVLGPDELKANQVTLKNMTTGKQQTISSKDLLALLVQSSQTGQILDHN